VKNKKTEVGPKSYEELIGSMETRETAAAENPQDGRFTEAATLREWKKLLKEKSLVQILEDGIGEQSVGSPSICRLAADENWMASEALQTILTYRNQTEIDFALQVAKMFAALEFDPKTGHYSNDSLGVPRESKKTGNILFRAFPSASQRLRGSRTVRAQWKSCLICSATCTRQLRSFRVSCCTSLRRWITGR
jgi:hypothetical protein